MTRRAVAMVLLGIGVLVAVSGIMRLRFDPDILGMLPPDSPEVGGLRAFQEGFAASGEAVVLIEGDESREGEMAALAESLADAIGEAGVARRVRWRPAWMDGGGMAEWLAFLWLNGPPDAVEKQAAALAPERLEATLQNALADVATALEGEELAMRANDPLGFLRHPGVEPLLENAGDGVEGYESPDGRAHLLFVEAPRPVTGYREAEAWLEEIRAVIDVWENQQDGGLDIHLTGEPAFAAEIGGAMERDMRSTAGITAGLIALLFWWVQRRLALLGGLLLVLALVFLTAIGMAGWIYGELSVMAAAFAAILIGLAVDYGVLICQEAKACGHDRAALWRATRGSVLWAAATTAVVFFALNGSGLPGIAQLGTVVACGVLAGAALMLGYYLPFVSLAGGGRETRTKHVPVPPLRTALTLAAVLAVAAAAVLIWRGFPEVDFDERLLRPRDSGAMAAFDRVREKFPGWGDNALRIVVEADDDAAMHARIAEARGRLENEAAVDAFVLPETWWPDAARQSDNRPLLREIAARADAMLAAADEAGFSADGLAPTREVLMEMARMSGDGSLVFPESEGAREIMGAFVARDADGGGKMAGIVHMAEGVDATGEDFPRIRSLNAPGIRLAGWDLIKPAVVPLVRRDVTHVLLPMTVLMMAMLAAVFRSMRVVALCLATMALSGLILLAAMSWLGIGWNFLNIAAAPLLLGIGIDYGIHIGLSLRRHGGDIAAMWHGTGKAVVFCGVSTAIGFGSLCFASNDATASLGTVAVTGILVSMLVSALLLPPLLAREFTAENRALSD
ncbi:MAG TPA: MMPL family transporter [Luteolibacter sp.]|nr:MMPL family transporter [Luteolibacter sp.]